MMNQKLNLLEIMGTFVNIRYCAFSTYPVRPKPNDS